MNSITKGKVALLGSCEKNGIVFFSSCFNVLVKKISSSDRIKRKDLTKGFLLYNRFPGMLHFKVVKAG